VRGRFLGLVLVGGALLAACDVGVQPSPSSPSAVPSETAEPSPSPSVTARESATVTASPSPSPEPSLALGPPEGTDPRTVSVEVAPEVAAEGGGRIVVTVTSGADSRIDEIVLRWPTELADTLFLAPFEPTPDRIADGGPPLVQPWTKWVVGPGERGEPDGTTSLGWGPLLAGATLEIPILVTREAPGPVDFDLQVLAGNDLLTLADGTPAELRVEIP
jgi:hypothetical protein